MSRRQQQAVLHGLPEPTSGQTIARIVKARGNGVFEVLVPSSFLLAMRNSSQPDLLHTGAPRNAPVDDKQAHVPELSQGLCKIPSRFAHGKVWVGKGQFVICELDDSLGAAASLEELHAAGGDGDEDAEGVLPRYEAVHLLFEKQIKHLQALGVWPDEFVEETAQDGGKDALPLPTWDSDDDEDDGLMVRNPNQARRMEDSSSDDEDSD